MVTIPTAPTTISASHARRGAGGLESRERMNRTSHTAKTPMP
jgi:hypothetical protein